VTIESQSSRVYRSFGKLGFGSRGDDFLDIAIIKIVIREIPERKEERSSLTIFGLRGFKRPTLGLRTRESAKSDLRSAKRGSHEDLLWVQIF
jgi:hypothetical protein